MRHSMAWPRCVSSSCAQGSRPPSATVELRANEVDARDCLGDGMLDLQPGVHLQKVEARVVAAAFDEELDRSRVAIAGRARRGDGGFTHSATQVRADGR